MAKASVIVYWIDESFSVRSEVLHPYHLKGGATYETEAWHISNDAEHIEIIILDRAGNSLELERVDRLKKKAQELKNKGIQ